MIEAADGVLGELGDPAGVIGSENGTWLDRVEAAALRRSEKRAGRRAAVSSVRGDGVECFTPGRWRRWGRRWYRGGWSGLRRWRRILTGWWRGFWRRFIAARMVDGAWQYRNMPV